MRVSRLAVVVVFGLGCGGPMASPQPTPPENHDPAPAAVEIAAQLKAAEFNALMADGTLTLLRLEASSSAWRDMGDTVDGRVLGDGDTISIERCFSSVSFVVDAEGGVYPIMSVSLGEHGISTEFGLRVASCQVETYQLASGQTFAHKIEITDYDEYVRAHQGGDE